MASTEEGEVKVADVEFDEDTGQIKEISGRPTTIEMKRDALTDTHIRAYSVGHLQNDLCASMWFIYLNYYFLYVVHLPPNIAAAGLLSGQVTDGLTTPLVGVLSDKFDCPFGKRNTWYFFGTILVFPCFLGIFITTPSFLNSLHAEAIWYCTLPSIFNVGWASV